MAPNLAFSLADATESAVYPLPGALLIAYHHAP
jgi:hypothetical protein